MFVSMIKSSLKYAPSVKCSTIRGNEQFYTYQVSTELIRIIQLMHSFEVNIRICQLEKSDVHRGEAEVNITFEG